jgi:two-component sensor histidine kinase
MAIIHETLSRVSDVTRVNAGDYMPELVQSLSISYGVAGRVSLGVDVADVWLGLDVAFPCGLIVNELVSNALKHAFPGGRAGQVRVVMAAEAPGRIALTVADDGVGLPPDLDWHSTRSLGLRLVQRLVRQIRGEMTVSGSPGTTFTVIF